MTLRTITLPAPIPFTRSGYGDILAEHRRLLVQHAPQLHAEARKRLKDDELDFVDHYAGRIVVRGPGGEDTVDVQHVRSAIRYWRGLRGIAGRMCEQSRGRRLYVAVAAGGVASLHTMRLDERELVPDESAIVIEPTQQRHWHSGVHPLLVTRWVEPWGETRYAWAAIPPEPASAAEATSRLIAYHDARARRELASYLAKGKTAPSVWIRSDSLGDVVTIFPVDRLLIAAQGYPRVHEAVQQGGPPGRVPVVGATMGHARLRWIDVAEAGPAPELPAELVEAFDWPPELADLEDGPADGDQAPEKDEDADESWLDVHPKARKRGPAEVWRELELDVLFDAIETHLATMTREELDRTIADAGFDPVTERARGAGFREEVIDAIASKRPVEE